MEAIDALIAQLRKAKHGDREAIKEELLTLARGPRASEAREYMEQRLKGEVLEVQWEIEEVLEATAPKKPEPPAKPAPEPEPEPEQADPNRPLTQADLKLVYDDPRGLMLHKTKVGNRWFVTQVDPRTGQPQTFELHAQEVQQIKAQLQGSPYWMLGAD